MGLKAGMYTPDLEIPFFNAKHFLIYPFSRYGLYSLAVCCDVICSFAAYPSERCAIAYFYANDESFFE